MMGNAAADSVRENHYREWGRALLVYAGYADGQTEDADDTVFGDERINGKAFEGERADQEKMRSFLRSMEEQVSREIGVRTGRDDFHLTYKDSILQNRTIRRMMEHVVTLDAEEYPRFVRELSETVVLRWQERQGSRTAIEKVNQNQHYSGEPLQLVHTDTLTDSSYPGQRESDRRNFIPGQNAALTDSPYLAQRQPDRKELMPGQTAAPTDSPYLVQRQPDRSEHIPVQGFPDNGEYIPGVMTGTLPEEDRERIRRTAQTETVTGTLPEGDRERIRRAAQTEAAGTGYAAESAQEKEFREWGRALLVYAGHGGGQESDTASGVERADGIVTGTDQENGTVIGADQENGTAIGADRGNDTVTGADRRDDTVTGYERYNISESEEKASTELILREERDSADQDGKTAEVSRYMEEIRAGQAMQPTDIRRQIEMGKMRSRLRSMEEQISRQISVQTGRDDFHLSYEDGILQDRTIRKMVDRVGTLDAEEYPQFVRQLSESVYRQMQEQQNARAGQSLVAFLRTEQTGSRAQNQGQTHGQNRKDFVQRGTYTDQGTAYPDSGTLTNLAPIPIPGERIRTEEEYRSARERVLTYERERRVRSGEWAHRFRAVYAANGDRQTQTEREEDGSLYDGDPGRTVRQMVRMASGDILNPEAKTAANAANPGLTGIANDTEAHLTLNQSDKAGDSPYGEREESPRVYTDNTAMQSILTQTQIRVQEESTERKNVQKQINSRLDELEQQLSQKIKRAGAAESAATLAEQVKRQLHEELHMERLRRGLS
ncbi:MAG: hypothetical protein LIO96_02755 [Lachnospiraceae bacterium]|nr:hypothetical protein [Lachnospiraceae bacterium]